MSQPNALGRRKILLITDLDPRIQPNQPFFHLVSFCATQFEAVDFVYPTKLYDGPPTTLPHKIARSLHNLRHARLEVSQQGNVRHIVVRRIKLPQGPRNLLGDLWAYMNLPRWLKKEHYDLCIYSHPQNVFLVNLLRRRGVVQNVIYYDVDFFPDHIDSHGLFASSVLSWKEHLAVTGADGVMSVSTPLARLRESQGAKAVLLTPNAVDLNNFAPARQQEPHGPTLLYIGMLSEPWGVDLVLEALPKIRQEIPEIKFNIVGWGDYVSELESLTERLGLQTVVTFLGKQPYRDLAQFMKKASIGVAPYKNRTFIEYASPMKVREYMAGGLPVIASRIGEAQDIINISEAGELVDPAPDSIAAAAIKILRDPDLQRKYAENAVRYAADFDWTTIFAPVLGFAAHCAGSRAR